MECPNIDKRIIEDDFNIRVNYVDFGGADYVFYDHNDAYGNVMVVQFCKKIGREKDVFQCFNEAEWRVCPYYTDVIQVKPNQF